eukprot:GHUV01011796.1.p1 GENE.GHUV01011796.1~~GHUV01011796.1.p1  ORF type:complete len:536 (+),score=161.13 GHUV01011796.1:273-1880(+)
MENQRACCRHEGAATVFFARCPPVTTEEQVHKLFSQFGHVEEVNLYRRWQSAKTSKGCGFVRFSERSAAAAALEALNNKHMFENSEAPMVVEWIDPARVANRHHSQGDKHMKSRKSHQQAAGRIAAQTRQPLQKPPAVIIATGQLSDQSSMSTQLSPFSSGNSFVEMEDAHVWPGKDQNSFGCPVHVVPILSQAKCASQLPAGPFGARSLQNINSWVRAPAAAAGPTLNTIDSHIMPSTNSPWLAEACNMNKSAAVGPPCYASFSSTNHAMLGAAAGSGCISNSFPVCNSGGAPVLNLNELAQLGSCLVSAGYSGQLSGMVSAELDSCAGSGMTAGLGASASTLDPAYSSAPLMTCVGEFSHPLYGVANRSTSNAAMVATLSGRQLQPGTSHPATAAAVPSAAFGAVLQPLAAAGSSNSCNITNQLAGGFGTSPAAIAMAATAGPAALPTQGVNHMYGGASLKLNIVPIAASNIVANMDLLSKLSGATFKLVAMGERGIQLNLTGTLAELDAAYQMVCLLHPQGQVPAAGLDLQG